MRVLQLFRCVWGKHLRSRRFAWSDGTYYHSRCVGCGKPLIRDRFGWHIDSAPPIQPDSHSKTTR